MSTEQVPQTVQTLRSVPGRRRWPTVVLMIVVFVAGIAIGIGVNVIYYDQFNEYYRAHPEKLPERFASRIGKKLDLSRDQVRQVREIFAQRWPALQEARRQTYPILKPELERLDQQVSALLNDRQKQKWNKGYSAFIQRMYSPGKASSTQPATLPAGTVIIIPTPAP